MTGLYTEAFLSRLGESVQSKIGAWGASPKARVSLLNISENATFRVDDPEAANPFILRAHRPDYHTHVEIASELAWIDALRAEQAAQIPAPLSMINGERIAEIQIDGEVRYLAAFEFMSGAEPAPTEDLRIDFTRLGAVTARLHQQALRWERPASFTRKIWSLEAAIGRQAYWGDWRDALGLPPDGAAVLECLVTALHHRLAAFGHGPDRFGLIHADLRLANLLIDGDRIGVIDFDDCGFGWLPFDFAAAISFYETDPAVPALLAAWLQGYRQTAPFPPEWEAEIPTFIMLRRLQLTAWVASHSETPTAQEMGVGFTHDTVALAERFMAGRLFD
ncbi:MAG: phosphotransferase [Rhodobacteraceae bacterium]|nr:phosphotransferase [Paracoccaceae bacterium]